MQQDLIYDVGMHNGDDTAYYLTKGYRVVAVEANPALVEQARQRFADKILDARLNVLNLGIDRMAGLRPFWINQQQSQVSSFDKEMASRFGGECEAVEVTCVPFRELLDEHGVPYYLKIDIEGADEECLRALTPSDLPQYVSVEAHSLGPLFLLRELGYDAFKCINQLHHHDPPRGINDASELSRTAREAWGALKASLSSGVRKVPGGPSLWEVLRRLRTGARRRQQTCTAEADPTSNGSARRPSRSPDDVATEFPHGCTGPFGEETYGQWRSFEEVAYDWLHIKMGRPVRSTLTKPGWYDFHAKRT